MKRVVPSSEVYHLYAHETQEEARSGGGGNVSFDGDTAYSYGTPIGQRVVNPNGIRGYLITKHQYSVTTSGHVSMLREALRFSSYVFHVEYAAPGGRNPHSAEYYSHEMRLKDYLKTIAESSLKAKRARTAWSIERHIQDAQEAERELEKYCQFFEIAAPQVDTDALAASLADKLAERRALEAKEQAARKEREAIAHAERLAKLPALIEQWRNGDSVRLPYDCPIVLRLETLHSERIAVDEPLSVETSLGARVPLAQAERLFRAWLDGAVKPGDQIGHYSVTRIDNGEALQIGCHLITRAEAERFAASMGWATQPYQPKTGQPCGCRKGVERDNCPQCEGTGQRIDFAAIRARSDNA